MHASRKNYVLNFLRRKVLFVLVVVMSFSFLILSGPAPSMAQSKTSIPLSQENKMVALRFAKEGWGTQPHWQQVWDELMAPDVIYHFNSFPDKVVGLEANKEFNKDLFVGFPKLQNTVENIVANDDVVIYRSTLEGQQSGPFLGMPATNKKAKMNDFTMLKIKDGKISEWWYETNLLSLMQQLDIMPES